MSSDAPQRRGRRHSPNRLYRDPDDGKILGVCAGIADFFGFNPWAVRLGALIALFLFPPPAIIAYLLAGLVLDRRPPDLYRSPSEERFWRSVRTEPSRTAHDLDLKFRELERRLRSIEAYVTSQEFKLRRAFDDLER